MIFFKEKQVAVLGAGIEGLSSATYLKKAGAKVTVLDQKTENSLEVALIERYKSLEVETVFSPDCLADLSKFEVLVRTPGIRPDVPEIAERVKSGAILTSNTQIFFDLCPCPIIGVTGTKGKGTTSTLVYKILQLSGRTVFLGGNIGTPALDLLPNLLPESWVVLELSSFQLFDLKQSPHIAVVLMVVPEHLDYHKSVKEYKEAKFNILAHQGATDFAVINIDYPTSKEFLNVGLGRKIQVSTKEKLTSGVFVDQDGLYRSVGSDKEHVTKLSEIGLVGGHNVENVAAAVGVATVMGVGVYPIAEAVKSFKGLEHRLELVKEINGVKYYNDSFSTTPETAIAAIKSFTQPELVILGGSDKGSDYTELGQTIVKSTNVKAVVLIGQMAGKIKNAIEKAGEYKGQVKEGAKDMAEIMSQVKEVAQSGDVVLLSPACASFGMFKNYKERGNQFKDAVNKL